MHADPFPVAQLAQDADQQQLQQQQQLRSAPMVTKNTAWAPASDKAGSSAGLSSSPPVSTAKSMTVWTHPSAPQLAEPAAPQIPGPGRPGAADGAASLGHAKGQLLTSQDGPPPIASPPAPMSPTAITSHSGLSDRVMSRPAQLFSKLKLGGGKKGSKPGPGAFYHLTHPHLPASGGSTPKESGSGAAAAAEHMAAGAAGTTGGPAAAAHASVFEMHPRVAASATSEASAGGRSLLSGSYLNQSLSVEVPATGPAASQGPASAQHAQHSSSTYHPSPYGGGASSSGSSSMPSSFPRVSKAGKGRLSTGGHAAAGANGGDEAMYHHNFLMGNSGFVGHGTTEATVEEFSPGATQPHNPLAPLLTPFRLMAPVAHKAIAAAKADMKKNWKQTAATSRAFVHMGAGGAGAEGDSAPPMGYMWLWLGSFMRWQRRFFVASEAPGLLLIYKRSGLKGKVWSISLRDAVLEADEGNPRQLKISAPQGEIFLRTMRSADREKWLQCLKHSIEVYKQNQLVVEVLKDKGLLGQSQDANTTTAAMGGPVLPLPEVAEMDVEQRRRIRFLTAERLAHVGPYQAEMERQMLELSSKLKGAASGIAEQPPRGSASKTLSSPPQDLLNQPCSDQQPQEHDSSSHKPLDVAAAAQAAAHDLGQAPVAAAAAGISAVCHEHGAEVLASSEGVMDWCAAQARMTAGAPRQQCQSVQQAYSQLIEAMRCGFHADAVRTVQLEMENFALSRTVAYLKQQHSKGSRQLDRLRTSTSTSRAEGREGTPPASATKLYRQSPSNLYTPSASLPRESSGRLDDTASVMTADEDAFDVTEAFDEGVDYSILDDDPDEPTDNEDALAGLLMRRNLTHTASGKPSPSAQPSPRVVLSPGDPQSSMGSTAAFGGVPTPDGTGDGPRRSARRRTTRLTTDICDEDADDDEGYEDGGEQQGCDEEDEEEAEQAKVLNALEVVRQVEYVEKVQSAEGLTNVLTTQAPPTAKERTPREHTGGAPDSQGNVVEEASEEDGDEEEDNDEEEGGPESKSVRTRLPMPRPLGKGFSLWSLMKNMIGKDLTRITMPATINEPTSSLQRLCESLEYACLLDRLPSEPNSLDRLMLVAVWNLTCYNSLALRDGKPFNPLLGETYEWQSPDHTKRYVSEQVSHHPPVLAYLADSTTKGWELQGELETKSKFWGKSVEVFLYGCEALRTQPWGDEFRWSRATICVSDVILGNYWVQVYGKVKIMNTKTGEYAMLNFKPCRGRKQDRGLCDAVVYDAKGNEVWRIDGSVHESLTAQLTPRAAAARKLPGSPAPKVIWTKEPYPEDAAMQYMFTKFAIGLNDPADPIVAHLPPTDTRFRQDQRALELGEFNRSTTEKLRLEEKQRQVRRERAARGVKYEPLWFKQADPNSLTHLPHERGMAWQFNPDYWRRAEHRDWSVCPDLYSVDGVPVPVPPAIA